MSKLWILLLFLVVTLALFTSSTPVVAQETIVETPGGTVPDWPCESRFVTTSTQLVVEEIPVSVVLNWPCESRFVTTSPQLVVEESPAGTGLDWPCESRFVTTSPPLVVKEIPVSVVLDWPCESRFVAAAPAERVANTPTLERTAANKTLYSLALAEFFAEESDTALYHVYSADLAKTRTQEWLAWKSAFPDLQLTLDFQIAEGDRVLNCWTFHGTQTGEFLGIPPTGKEVTFRGLYAARFADGKIVEEVSEVDRYGLMQQLGAIPTASL